MDLQKINYQPLFDKINECLGVQIELTMDFSGKRPDIKSPNIVEHCGAMKAVYSEATVGVFSGNATGDYLWLNINMFWQYKGGGSNGATMFDAFYNYESAEWIFKFTR